MQRPSGVGKEGRGNPNSRERYCANWWDDIPSVPYGKGDVRKAVGRCLTLIEEGISKRPCGSLATVGALCCVRDEYYFFILCQVVLKFLTNCLAPDFYISSTAHMVNEYDPRANLNLDPNYIMTRVGPGCQQKRPALAPGPTHRSIFFRI